MAGNPFSSTNNNSNNPSSSRSNTNNNNSGGGPVRSESLNKRLVRITNNMNNQDVNINDLRARLTALEAENNMFREIIVAAFPDQWTLLKMRTKQLCELTPAEKALYLQSNPHTTQPHTTQPPQHHGLSQTNLQQGSWGSMPQQPGISGAAAAPPLPTPQLSQQLAAAQAMLAFDPQVNQLVASLAPHIGRQPSTTQTTASLPSLLQVRSIGSASSLASTFASSQLPNPSAGPIARSAANRGDIGDPCSTSKRSSAQDPGPTTVPAATDNSNSGDTSADPNSTGLPASEAGMKE